MKIISKKKLQYQTERATNTTIKEKNVKEKVGFL